MSLLVKFDPGGLYLDTGKINERFIDMGKVSRDVCQDLFGKVMFTLIARREEDQVQRVYMLCEHVL